MKKPARVCVILPRLPPQVDGLGDYTIQVWRYFHDKEGQVSPTLDKNEGWYFLTSDGTEDSSKHFPLASIRQLPRQWQSLEKELNQTDIVLLQFSGYGFDRNGIPFYLLHCLERWLKGGHDRRLVTMFHELYAVGPPWKKAFWLTLPQRRLTMQLCKISAVSVTSNHDYLNKLQRDVPNGDIRLIPMGATFDRTKNLPKDWASLCIFGKARLDSIVLHRELITYLAQEKLIRSVVLCGEQGSTNQTAREVDLLKQYNPNIEINEAYDFPTDDVPDLVARCGFSVTNVKSELLAKSTRFQLACALGQVTLSLKGNGSNCTPMLDAVSLIEYDPSRLRVLRTRLADIAMLEKIGQEARRLSETEFSWKHNNAKWREILK